MLIYGATHTGRARENNQDAYYISPQENTNAQTQTPRLLVVADGMGGHKAGEIASALTIGAIKDRFSALKVKDTDRRSMLTDMIEHANEDVFSAAKRTSRYEGMGTTVVAVLADYDKITIANVGDSRAYLYTEKNLRQITTDHSFVQELLSQGVISSSEAIDHPKRNVITRAVGIDPSISPDIFIETWKQGDKLLLCSDGLTGQIEDADIAMILAMNKPVSDLAEILITLANSRGGKDNITLILAQR